MRDLECGWSGFCMGKMKDAKLEEFKFRDALHKNTHYLCVYTPLKGWVKLMVNIGDCFLILKCMDNIFRDGSWFKCRDCGKTEIMRTYWREEDGHTCEVCRKLDIHHAQIKTKIKAAIDHIESDEPVDALEYLIDILKFYGDD